jgi:pimeloyl-ACP methyl ester carboxylesterase
MSTRHFRETSMALLILFSYQAACCFGQEEEELEIPDSKTVKCETRDGVSILCTYYPGGFVQTGDKANLKVEEQPGKETVPIIMLHGWEGRRTEFDGLATALQKKGHAVIAPDLRGHGDSTSRKLPDGQEKDFDLKRMKSGDMRAMVLGDLEAVKKFLLKKNNLGELNIELLCVVGADVGGTVAMNWAAYDWSRQQLPAFKQGRDVRALVLLSPLQSFKGFSLRESLQHPIVKSELSIMLVAGQQDRKTAADAKAIFSRLQRHRELPQNPKERLEKQDLFYIKPDTNLKGTRLLFQRGLTVSQTIDQFINLRLVRKTENHPWTERKSPF